MELVLPSERYGESFLAAEQEMFAAGDREDIITAETLPAKLVRWEAMRQGVLADTRVPSTVWWLVETSRDEFIGRIAIRHFIDERLRRFGGHIGYDVRPSRRREGIGTRMLRLAMPHAKLPCDKNNIASRRMIESCGGSVSEEFEYEGTTRLRLWLPTSQ